MNDSMFSEQIKQHRERLGLTQSSLAQILSVTGQTVYLWEAEKSKPSKMTREAILAKLEQMQPEEARA
jgi:DNA-binding XRE family transcriptional regulator